MTMGTQNKDEAKLSELTKSWVVARRAKDVDALMSHYASDVLLYDHAPPLRYHGVDVYRQNWEANKHGE